MTLLLAKLLLTPLLIAAVTLAGRRWGPAVGGWLAGLPLTSRPVSVFLALEQGPGVAARAAVGALAGPGGGGVFFCGYFPPPPPPPLAPAAAAGSSARL